jgi:ubiquinone biosynthesis protein Coq4
MEICSVTIPSDGAKPHPIYHAGSSCDTEILEEVAMQQFFFKIHAWRCPYFSLQVFI